MRFGKRSKGQKPTVDSGRELVESETVHYDRVTADEVEVLPPGYIPPSAHGPSDIPLSDLDHVVIVGLPGDFDDRFYRHVQDAETDRAYERMGKTIPIPPHIREIFERVRAAESTSSHPLPPEIENLLRNLRSFRMPGYAARPDQFDVGGVDDGFTRPGH